jgi:predicted O-methyltransferase YrrM
VDTSAFAAALDAVFAGRLADGVPRDGRFADVVEAVPGFCTAAELAVLNLAVRLLPAGEAYLEVGTFKGRSLCGALLDAPQRTYLAVENFHEFGMVADSSRAELAAHLDRYGLRGRLRLHDADCFALLARADAVPEPVGVYFYDGGHTAMAHYLALGVVEPLLADEALVIIDDAAWPVVAAATARYLRRHPGWQVLREIRGAGDHDPVWANGVLLLAYHRPVGAARRAPVDVRWRRFVQVHLRTPMAGLVWRTLHRLPVLSPVAKRLVRTRTRTVPAADAPTGPPPTDQRPG